MTSFEFMGLKPGDLIRHKSSGSAVIVHRKDGMKATAVRVFDVSNPDEWDRVNPDGSVKGEHE